MICDSLHIDYDILEANNRIGGRLFTHRFNGNEGLNAEIGTPARYDYFDVGAMRFPKIPFMDRLWDLFDDIQIEGLLVDYRLSAPNTLQYFNTRPPLNSTVAPVADEDDYFHVSVQNAGAVPNHFFEAVDRPPVEHWTGLVYDYYKNMFAGLDDANLSDDERHLVFAEAWAELTSEDHHTTRSAMRAGLHGTPSYPNTVINWLETFDSATGLYDRAFVESVMDSLDFGWPWPQVDLEPPAETEWFCIDGGSDHISREMALRIDKQPEVNKQVLKVSQGDEMSVHVAGEAAPRPYTQVISTVTLGCLAAIDIEDCNLLYTQKQAVRALSYDASTKVGIKFATRWGTSSTDTPIRTCVYPSYGLNVVGAPGVLLASYTWAQDALRLGAISDGAQNTAILDLALDNLSKLHGIPRAQFGPVLDFFAHSFYADPYARGAFALFGPGQFGHPGEQHSMFTSLKAPAANGRFHIAGEATSVHHGWVLGALNSAWRAVYNVLDGHPELQDLMIAMWGIPDEENELHLKWLIVLAQAGWL
ncbi:hypothetical protein BJ912DRAFT_1024006 [Pholiota molesta]|nr:hypothetical protein BJ912DRAFT_1024006 [Pholiota molesta]